MSNVLRSHLLGTVLLGSLLGACAPSQSEIARRASAALVHVETTDAHGNVIGQGSGFFMQGVQRFSSPDPLRDPTLAAPPIVTALHVLKWASAARVKTFDNVIHQVTSVSALDVGRDLCVLDVLGQGSEYRGLPLAPDRSFNVGDSVFVAGNPEGLRGTFSRGIVSADRPDEHLIQIDAPISRGSSGGPVLDNQGRVIGVAVATFASGQNLNFASVLSSSTRIREHELDVREAGWLALNDLELEHLKGRCRSVIETTIVGWAADETGHLTPVRNRVERVARFNQDGMLVSISFPGGAGLRPSHIEHEYFERHLERLPIKDPSVLARVDRELGFLPIDVEPGYRNWRRGVELRLRNVRSTFEQKGIRLDAFANVVSESDGSLVTVHENDSNGNTSVEHHLDEAGRTLYTVRYQYAFDHEGNWVRRVDDYSGWIAGREISYW